MADKLETSPEVGVMTLFGGVITDVHRLISQQLALFRHQIQGDFNRVGSAGFLVAAGMVILSIGGVTLCGMLALLTAHFAPDFPLWACYGVVGAPVFALGATLCLVGTQRLKRLNATAVASAQVQGERTHG